MSGLRVVFDGHVALLELCRPPTNYFDEQLITELVEAAQRLDVDPHCRAMVLASEGKHFCAGADFGKGGGFEQDKVRMSSRLYWRAVQLFEIGTPVIAAVQGAAVGGGLGLACTADFRVVDEASRFMANFALLGFHQGFGLSVTLPELVGRQAAADLLFTGRPVHGIEAVQLGLADRLSEPGRQRETALEFAHAIAAAAPLAVRSIRTTLRIGLADRVRASLDRELAEQARLWATSDSVEGITASRERRQPNFIGR